jgi:hypothetical protein
MKPMDVDAAFSTRFTMNWKIVVDAILKAQSKLRR